MLHNITVNVEDKEGIKSSVEIPVDMGMSLMELLKANGYNIEATCGGIALCATCHIKVLSNTPLPDPRASEAEMLDLLPNLTDHSRLSCQIRPNMDMDGLTIKILGEQ